MLKRTSHNWNETHHGHGSMSAKLVSLQEIILCGKQIMRKNKINLNTQWQDQT